MDVISHDYLYVEEYLPDVNQYLVRSLWQSTLIFKQTPATFMPDIAWSNEEHVQSVKDKVIDGIPFRSTEYNVSFVDKPSLHSYIKVSSWDTQEQVPEVDDYDITNVVTKHELLRYVTNEAIPELHNRYTFVIEDCKRPYLVQLDGQGESYELLKTDQHFRCNTTSVEEGGYLMTTMEDITPVESVCIVEASVPVNNSILRSISAFLKKPTPTSREAFFTEISRVKAPKLREAMRNITKLLPTANTADQVKQSMNKRKKNASEQLSQLKEEPIEKTKKKQRRERRRNMKKLNREINAVNAVKERIQAEIENLRRDMDDLTIGDTTLGHLRNKIEQGNICALAIDQSTFSELPYASAGSDDELTNSVRRSVVNVIREFYKFYIGKATHVFQLYDFNNGLLTTHEMLKVYDSRGGYTPDQLLVWKYRKQQDHQEQCDLSTENDKLEGDIYVLANGIQLVLETGQIQEKYNGIFLSQSPKMLIESYKSLNALQLSNLIRLQFFNQRIISKGSFYRHDMRGICDKNGSTNAKKWQKCEEIMNTFNTTFWGNDHPNEIVYEDDRVNGVVYRLLKGANGDPDTLFAYKLMSLEADNVAHAAALMMYSTGKDNKKVAYFDVNTVSNPKYVFPSQSKTEDAQSTEVHQSIDRGLCNVHTYLCAEIYLLCAPLWKDLGEDDHTPTGMLTSREALHRWLINNEISGEVLEVLHRFDKLPDMPSTSVLERRKNWQPTSTNLQYRTLEEYAQQFASFEDQNDFANIPPQTLFASLQHAQQQGAELSSHQTQEPGAVVSQHVVSSVLDDTNDGVPIEDPSFVGVTISIRTKEQVRKTNREVTRAQRRKREEKHKRRGTREEKQTRRKNEDLMVVGTRKIIHSRNRTTKYIKLRL